MKNRIYPLILILPLFAAICCKKSDKKSVPPGSADIKDSVLVSGLNFPW